MEGVLSIYSQKLAKVANEDVTSNGSFVTYRGRYGLKLGRYMNIGL